MKIRIHQTYPRLCGVKINFPLSGHAWLAMIIILPLLWGCAPGKEARQVSRVTLANLINYEKEVQKKVEAENSYYQQTVAVLQDTLKWDRKYGERIWISDAVLDFDNFLANPKNRFDDKELRHRIAQLLESIRQSRTLYAEARVKYREDLLKSLETLEIQEKSLNQVAKGLERMQVKSIALDMVMGWVKLWKEMEDKSQKEKESQKAASLTK